MPKPMSVQMREAVVRWRLDDGKSVEEIVELTKYSKSTIYTVLKLWETYGMVINPHAYRTGRPQQLAAATVTYLLWVLKQKPTLYLEELREIARNDCDDDVSLAQLSRRLVEAGITHKSCHYLPSQQDEELRNAWLAAFTAMYDDPAMFMFLDESAVDERTAHRRFGYSPMGTRCVERSLLVRGTRYSVLPALSLDGIIALDVFEGAVDRERFIEFLRNEIVPVLNPYPGKHSVVIMDNCSTHHDEEIRALIEDTCGARLVYLPPYSPDFNPIAEAFSALKHWLRHNEHRLTSNDDLPELIIEGTMSITPEMAAGWFSDSGYL